MADLRFTRIAGNICTGCDVQIQVCPVLVHVGALHCWLAANFYSGPAVSHVTTSDSVQGTNATVVKVYRQRT